MRVLAGIVLVRAMLVENAHVFLVYLLVRSVKASAFYPQFLEKPHIDVAICRGVPGLLVRKLQNDIFDFSKRFLDVTGNRVEGVLLRPRNASSSSELLLYFLSLQLVLQQFGEGGSLVVRHLNDKTGSILDLIIVNCYDRYLSRYFPLAMVVVNLNKHELRLWFHPSCVEYKHLVCQ